MRLERVYMWIILLCTPLLGVLSVTDREPEDGNKDDSGKVLSRQRRYLTFPEGSSLQVGNQSMDQNSIRLLSHPLLAPSLSSLRPDHSHHWIAAALHDWRDRGHSLRVA